MAQEANVNRLLLTRSRVQLDAADAHQNALNAARMHFSGALEIVEDLDETSCETDRP